MASYSNENCAEKADETKKIDPPRRKNLPFFAYGFFKPHQLAYPQIKKYIIGEPEQTEVKGILQQVNGTPVLLPSNDKYDTVKGYLIKFEDNFKYDAYREIGYSKNRGIYEWKEMIYGNDRKRANVLVASKPYLFEGNENWYEYYEGSGHSYDWREDHMFKESVDYIKNLLKIYETSRNLKEEAYEDDDEEDVLLDINQTSIEIFKTFQNLKEEVYGIILGSDRPKGPREKDYQELLDLQMYYMLLWTSIDRFLSFRYGEIKKNNVINLSEEKAFRDALKKYVHGKRKVYSARDLRYYKLNPKKPACSAMYYYTIRNNVVHTGKTLTREEDMLFKSLKELLNIYIEVLDATRKE